MKLVALLSGIALAASVPVSAATVTATISSTFTPTPVTIVEGDTLMFQNVGGGLHNVVADNSSFRCANGCDDMAGDGDLSTANWNFSRFFATAGMIAYHCELHGGAGGVGMSGVIIVQPFTIFSNGFESGNTSAWSATTP